MVPEAGGREGLAEESSSVSVYLDCDVSIYVVATVCISLCQRYLVSTVCISLPLVERLCERRARQVL